MDSKQRIALAAAIGSFSGLLPYVLVGATWWSAALFLVGVVSAYILWDVPAFVAGAVRARRLMMKDLRDLLHEMKRDMSWRTTDGWLWSAVVVTSEFVSLVACAAAGPVLLVSTVDPTSSEGFAIGLLLSLSMVSVSALFLANAAMSAHFKKRVESAEEVDLLVVQHPWQAVLVFNPLSAAYFYVKAVYTVVEFLLTMLGRLMANLYRFTVSDERLAAAMGASMGLMTGYIASLALAFTPGLTATAVAVLSVGTLTGAVAGYALGALNWLQRATVEPPTKN